MDPPARLFLCARCRAQVVLCSHCDRGNRYCGRPCRRLARDAARRASASRYQRSRRGRLAHAERSRRWRQRVHGDGGREHNVTHQGCPPGLVAAPLLAWTPHTTQAPEPAQASSATVGKTPYVRFDTNDYSVPHTHVRLTLTVLADEQWVRVLDGATELARHRRCWDSHAQIEDDAHVQRLVDAKRAGRAHRACDRLAQAAPASAELLKRAGARGENLGSITASLMRLLDRWGAAALQAAITEALARDVAHPNAVRLALERARAASGEPPPVALVLPEHVAKRDAPVRTHDLQSYDRKPDRKPDQQPDHPEDPPESPDE